MVLSHCFSTLPLLWAVLTTVVTAFVVPLSFRPCNNNDYKCGTVAPPTIPSPFFLAKNSYLDDVAKDGPSDEDGDETDDGKATSPSYEYLEDSTLKEPETYLEDLAAKDKNAAASSSRTEGGSSSGGAPTDYLSDSSLKDAESYLDDMTSTSTKRSNDRNASSKSPSYAYLDDSVSDQFNDKKNATENGEDSSSSSSSFEKSLLGESVSFGTESDSNISSETALTKLLKIASMTGRGEFANPDQKKEAAELIAIMESKNSTPEPTNNPIIYGRWELLYSSTQLFRSSPFFMAGRAVCSTQDQAQQYDWFCDMHRKALAISNIGSVRQIVSPTLLVSEFEVKVGAIPFFNFTPLTPFPYSGGLPFTIDGAIVSSADITPTDNGRSWELHMDTVQIKGSNVPGLRRILDDGLKLNSRQLASFLEQNVDGYTTPRPVFETTYLSETYRISRDQDGKVFVYAKVSDDTTPTDYSGVEPDLGLLKFLEGLNDNVIKYYE